MSELRSKRRLELHPYTPKPGSMMCTHVDVILRRASERKVIRLDFNPIEVGENFTKFGLMSGKAQKIADSPTHAPKKFAEIEAAIFGQIDSYQGEYFDSLVEFLASEGMQLKALAPTEVA